MAGNKVVGGVVVDNPCAQNLFLSLSEGGEVGGLTDRLRVNKRAPCSNGPFVIVSPSLSLSLSVLLLFMFVGVCVFCVLVMVFGVCEGNHGTRTISYSLKS